MYAKFHLDKRTGSGQDEQSRKTGETDAHNSRYRTKDWKEKEVKSEAKEWTEEEENAEAAEAEHQRGEGWQIGTSSISQTGERRVVSSAEESRKDGDVEEGSSTTTKPKTMTMWSSHRKTHTEGRRKGKHRTTVSPLDPTEPPPPWVTTTEQLPTTTTTFVTHAPPPARLYLSAGYSTTDIVMLWSEIPADVLERAGFLSSNPATDIASRLQIAFERILPKGLQCQIVLMPEMSEPGSAFMRVEWFGKNEALNHTKTQWHTGWAEKACSPYVNQLSNHFQQNESLAQKYFKKFGKSKTLQFVKLREELCYTKVLQRHFEKRARTPVFAPFRFNFTARSVNFIAMDKYYLESEKPLSKQLCMDNDMHAHINPIASPKESLEIV
ncbi:hypothetical protein ANCCEY_11907 [Ancylostoma ceylanicum]|uniref:Uncharacterized protein n=1 Tax=Ancylostoma ceylanicum TaxID=53326 RepID=A0A0D6LCM5_9BILA|nr:hypothetical protein ANCCEY_11907 [Ancylostoma ceylanicum]